MSVIVKHVRCFTSGSDEGARDARASSKPRCARTRLGTPRFNLSQTITLPYH